MAATQCGWLKGRAGPHASELTTGVLTSQMLLEFGSEFSELDWMNYLIETVAACALMRTNHRHLCFAHETRFDQSSIMPSEDAFVLMRAQESTSKLTVFVALVDLA